MFTKDNMFKRFIWVYAQRGGNAPVDDMKTTNLKLKFRMAGSADRVCNAARIKVDGKGALIVFQTDGAVESFNISQLQSFLIQPVASKAA
jgi:hypothetical protein